MKFTEQEIQGVFVIEPQKFGDARGYFMETYRKEIFDRYVGEINFVQDNQSHSTYGVLEGITLSKGKLFASKTGKSFEWSGTRCRGRFAKIFSYFRKICNGRTIGRK